VSLALHLSADALADLRALDTPLQEQILDELEHLLSAPESIPASLPEWGIIHAFAREVGGELYLVAMTLHLGATGELLTVLGVRLLPA